MVGLAYELKETCQADPQDEKSTLMYKYRKIDVNFFEVFHYAFCFAGVLIGKMFIQTDTNKLMDFVLFLV